MLLPPNPNDVSRRISLYCVLVPLQTSLVRILGDLPLRVGCWLSARRPPALFQETSGSHLGDKWIPRRRITTRGATLSLEGVPAPTGVSIHAPARGATCHPNHTLYRIISFNPRPRAGGDGGILPQPADVQGFNPRPRAGGDQQDAAVRVAALRFQSTPPRGGRPKITDGRGSDDWFQSTPPRGGRPGGEYLGLAPQLFQSTPPRGGRPPCSAPATALSNRFNPRPRAGGDPHFR